MAERDLTLDELSAEFARRRAEAAERNDLWAEFERQRAEWERVVRIKHPDLAIGFGIGTARRPMIVERRPACERPRLRRRERRPGVRRSSRRRSASRAGPDGEPEPGEPAGRPADVETTFERRGRRGGTPERQRSPGLIVPGPAITVAPPSSFSSRKEAAEG
jgi:hypothetical protein